MDRMLNSLLRVQKLIEMLGQSVFTVVHVPIGARLGFGVDVGVDALLWPFLLVPCGRKIGLFQGGIWIPTAADFHNPGEFDSVGARQAQRGNFVSLCCIYLKLSVCWCVAG